MLNDRLSLIPLPLFINGKYTAQRVTGVQRVAVQLVQALDALEPEALGRLGKVTLLCPPQGRPPVLRQVAVAFTPGPRLPLHLWEQLVLPLAARSGRLLSLAGSAPWCALRPATMLHDAAVWDHPEAYTAGFVHWYRALFRRQARAARPLMTVSNFSRARLADCLGVPEDRLTVVPNGADHLQSVVATPGVLQRFGLTSGRFLLAVGSQNPTKNLALLQRAHADLPDPLRVPLVIVGGVNRQVFRSGPALGAGPHVQLLGVLGDTDLRALYQHAMLLAFPSSYEGFGLPPLEAMAEGCPVVLARAASMPEVCGEAARYVRPGDQADLTAALADLLSLPADRAALAQRGRQRAALFHWRHSALRLCDALEATA